MLLLAWFTYNASRRRRFLGWALITLLVFSNSFIVDEFVRHWEVEVVPLQAIDADIRTAIVLGGGVYHDKENGKVKYGKNADRYLSVLELYKNGIVDRILVTGGPANYLEPWAKESEIIRDLYVLCGIPSEAILIENRSLNTYENAVYSKEILEELGEERFLLITSSAHIRRAQACFEEQGISVQPYPSMKGVGNRRWELDYLLVPSLDNFSKWRGLIHEWIGFLSYKLRGYL